MFLTIKLCTHAELFEIEQIKVSKKVCSIAFFLPLLYSYLLIHAEIYMLDTYRRNELIRRKHDNDKDAGRLPYKNILPLTLLQGFERVVQGLRVRGSWRPNITQIF